MKLAAFDLDNTLLAGDSDYLWGRYLVASGLVDGAHYEAENQRFYAQYAAGTLDIHEFARFSLGNMGRIEPSQLEALRAAFVETIIRPIIAPGARALLDHHREAGHKLVIITATNSYITQPIADMLGVPTLLGTDPVYVAGRMTGDIDGVPCFQEGKVTRLQQWLADHRLEESWFYSDSANDLPLLEWADHPVAVDPCARLHAEATARGWPIMSLRGPGGASRPLV